MKKQDAEVNHFTNLKLCDIIIPKDRRLCMKNDTFLVLTKTLCVFVLLLLAFSFASCGIIMGDSEEEKAYQNAINSLTSALDSKDADAVYELFSPYVRAQDKDLKDQIQKLLSVYEGPTDEVLFDGLLSGGAHYEDGMVSKDADTVFPIRCGNIYYWCYLKLVYENTFDESKVGITQIDFYTADEYCIVWYDDDNKITDSPGLTVYAEKTVDADIHCISGRPLKFDSFARELDINEIKNFFTEKDSFTEFVSQFGESGAENIYSYYLLPEKNGEDLYLEVGVDGDRIYGAYIVDDFGYIETVFESG